MPVIRLIPYEIRKILSGVVFQIFLLLLLLANGAFCISHMTDVEKEKTAEVPSEMRPYVDALYESYLEDPAFFFAEYARVEEAYAQDSIEASSSRVYCERPYNDHQIFDAVYRIAGADVRYHEMLEQRISRIEQAGSNFAAFSAGKAGDNFLSREGQKRIEIYRSLLEKVHLQGRRISGWDVWFTYKSEFFLAAGAITLLTVAAAVGDCKSKFDAILRDTKFGGYPTAGAKMLTVAILSAGLTLFFSLVSFALIGVRTGFSDPSEAVQAISAMELTPAALSMAGAALLALFWKLFSAVTFGIVLFALSTLVKSYVFGIGTGFGLAGASYLLSSLDPTYYGSWSHVNFLSVYAPDDGMADYYPLDFFGRPVAISLVIPWIALLLTAMALSVSLLTVNRRRAGKLGRFKLPARRGGKGGEVSARIRRTLLHRAEKRGARHSTSFLFYELYKQKWVLLALAPLLLLKGIQSSGYYTPSAEQLRRGVGQIIARDQMVQIDPAEKQKRKSHAGEIQDKLSSIKKLPPPACGLDQQRCMGLSFALFSFSHRKNRLQ